MTTIKRRKDEENLFTKFYRKYGMETLLKYKVLQREEAQDPKKILLEKIAQTTIKLGPIFSYNPPKNFLSKMFTNPWTTCQGAATPYYFYLFKSDNTCLEIYDLSSCLWTQESGIKATAFSLRRSEGDNKLILSTADDEFISWKETFTFTNKKFQREFWDYLGQQALLIQKWFRGRKQRKKFLQIIKRTIKLQALIRGYVQRKKYLKLVDSIIKLQGFARIIISKRKALDLKIIKNISKYQLYRTKVVEEILSTEESYVKDLEMLNKFYYSPLKGIFSENDPKKAASLPFISPSDIATIFSNILDILALQKVFLESLRKVIENFTVDTLIGPTFLELTSKLHIYETYCNNYDDSLLMIEKCRKNELFCKVLTNSAESKDMKKIDLAGYLISPIQRTPRYEMLLRDLLKHTWAEHPDKKNLQEALDEIRKCAMSLNETKKKHSTKKKVAEFQDKFKKPDELEGVVGDANFITEGPVISYEETKTVKSFLFLFEDRLVLAKRSTNRGIKEGLNYKKTYRFFGAKSIPLEKLTQPAEAIDDFGVEKTDKEFGFKFVADNKTYRITVKDLIERGKWVKDINNARTAHLESENE